MYSRICIFKNLHCQMSRPAYHSTVLFITACQAVCILNKENIPACYSIPLFLTVSWKDSQQDSAAPDYIPESILGQSRQRCLPQHSNASRYMPSQLNTPLCRSVLLFLTAFPYTLNENTPKCHDTVLFLAAFQTELNHS